MLKRNTGTGESWCLFQHTLTQADDVLGVFDKCFWFLRIFLSTIATGHEERHEGRQHEKAGRQRKSSKIHVHSVLVTRGLLFATTADDEPEDTDNDKESGHAQSSDQTC